jgi:uncharacterized protein
MSTTAPTLEDYKDAIVQRILGAVQPRRIIIFGSAARGEMGPDSDIDILVVMPDGVECLRTEMDLYTHLSGLGIPKDVVVATETEVAERGDDWSLVLYPALREGSRCMPPTTRHAQGSAEEWILRAESDLALASAPLPARTLPADLAFHAQQAFEKALKAVYVHIGRPFRYTHDLDELLEGVAAQGINVPTDVAACVPLTAYATRTRYPWSGVVVTQEQLDEAVAIAAAVVEWAAAQVG